VAEPFELVDEPAAAAFGVLGVAAVEEFLAELVVGDAFVQDVVGGGEDLVGGRDRGFGVSAAAIDAVVAGGQVGAFGAHDGVGGFGQGAAQPFGALCCAGNYVAPGLSIRACWRGSGLAARHILGWSQALEEREQRVGWPVAARLGVRGGGAVERAPLEFHVGVDVFVGGVERLMAEP
jgi:hypothetical protein